MSNTVIGTISLIADIDTSKYQKGISDIQKANKSVDDSTESTVDSGNKNWAKMGVAIGAISGVVSSVFSRVTSIVTSTISEAINRVDTLNNSARTFENMGFSAAQVKSAMDALVTSIKGLPTPLNSAVSGLQLIVASTNDLAKSQKIYSALNDAILGFGGTADDVSGAILQISQAFSNGRIDAQTWNSLLQNNLGPALAALARQMGITSAQLKQGLSDGSISVGQFQDALIDLDTKGGGGMKSLQAIAHDATSGIGTGFANMQTAIARGIANMINAFGPKSISDSISNFGSIIESAFSWIAKNKDTVIAAFKGIAASLAVMVAASVVSGIASMITLIGTLITQIDVFATSMAAGASATEALNVALVANPIGLIVTAIAVLVGALVFLQTKFDIFGKSFDFIKQAGSTALNAIKSGLTDVGNFFSSVGSSISSGFTAAIDGVKTAFSDTRKVAEDVLNSIKGWVDDNATAIKNVSIVIGTLLLPKFTQIAAQAAVSAAQTIASWTVAGTKMATQFSIASASASKNAIISSAAWIKSAAISTAEWIKQSPKMIAQFAIASAKAVASAAITTAAWVASAATTLASWAATFAVYLATVAVAAAATLLAAGQFALAWLLALGPIGLIVAAVVGAAALIITNWNVVKGAFTSAFDWLKDNWPLVLSILTGPIGLAVLAIVKNWDDIKNAFGEAISWFGNLFSGVWNAITSAFGAVGSFFSGVWNTITGIFGKIGSTIGNAVGNAFKDAVNGILGFLQNEVNGIINIVNGALNAIDKITPGHLPRLDNISIPRLASGGIIPATPGGQLAILGEGGQDEAVIPLNKLDNILQGERASNKTNTQNITINLSGTFATSKQEQRKVAETIVQRLQEVQKSKGLGANPQIAIG